jgi:hypothetical protein
MKCKSGVTVKSRAGMTPILFVLFLGILAPRAAAQELASQTWPRIETARLLYLTCAVRAEVRLDGVLAGTTPILLELEPGERRLELSTREGVFRRRIGVLPASGELSRLEAVLEPYKGSLRIACEESGALLSVDGLPSVALPSAPLPLAEGEHQVEVTAPGRITFHSPIRISRDATVDLRVELAKGFPLRFANPPPRGSVLVILSADGKSLRSIDPGAAELLPAGMARFRLRLPSGYGADFSWDPAGAEAAAPPYSGRLLLENLPAGVSVEIDGLAAAAPDADASYTLVPGFHSLRIRRTGYMAIAFLCEIKPGEDTKPKLAFIEDRAFVQARKNALGLPFVISGGVLAAGGFVLNQDSSAIALSSDYESYKLWKYLGLGVFGVGLAALAAGIGVVTIQL